VAQSGDEIRHGVVFHSDAVERSDCPITEGHSLEFAVSRLPMVLRHVEVVAQQLEDEDGVVLQEEVFMLQALLDHVLQSVR